jgi:hypothetical protein
MPLVAGLLVLGLIGLIPFLGVLVALVVILLGWGALLGWFWAQSRTEAA